MVLLEPWYLKDLGNTNLQEVMKSFIRLAISVIKTTL